MVYQMKALFPVWKYNIQAGEIFGVRDKAEYEEMVSSGIAEPLNTPTVENPVQVQTVKDTIPGQYQTKDERPTRGRPRGKTAQYRR